MARYDINNMFRLTQSNHLSPSGVLAAVANWFGPTKRGLIFGIWNSHTYMGNIAGAAIAGRYVQTNWGLSFIVPGLIIAATGLLVNFCLVPSKSKLRLDYLAEN